MPNGGHICCGYCDFADSGKCTLYGIPADINILCRHYRCDDGLSFGEYLATLEPGVIYKISLADINPHAPKPKYRVKIEPVKEQASRQWAKEYNKCTGKPVLCESSVVADGHACVSVCGDKADDEVEEEAGAFAVRDAVRMD